jgi:hypothetical protein
LLQAADLGAHLHAEPRVKAREQLVHQERSRLSHDRAPPHRHSLPLASGQGARILVEERLEVEDPRRLPDAPVDFWLLLLAQPEAEGDVVVDGQVRIEDRRGP